MDPYHILDLPKDAVLSELKTSYRKLAKIHHPDLPTGSADKFRELTKAYEALLPVVKDVVIHRASPKEKNVPAEDTFFRILDGKALFEHVDFIEDTIPARSRFKFIRGMKEFSVFFEEERKLPFTIQIDNLVLKFVNSQKKPFTKIKR
jgi:hypothetical protein